MKSILKFRSLVLLLAAAFASAPVTARAQSEQGPAIAALPGKPVLMLARYDLSSLGYQVDEFRVAGKATRYALKRPATLDGKLAAVEDGTADYATRYVVVRPSDPEKFNGTVLVEWLNVTAGMDSAPDWLAAHREILRGGYAYVAISAQKVGVDGGASVMGMNMPLTKADPVRYGSLSHPGDAYSFDIFSQAGRALKAQGSRGLLGNLEPSRVIGLGESQSAVALVTYVNAIDPLAKVYDGYLVHSRFGSGASLGNNRGIESAAEFDPQYDMPAQMRFRSDMRAPVLSVVTETDIHGARRTGYAGSRTSDGQTLRVWELAGAAHADGYLLGGALMDDGRRSATELAQIFRPSVNAPGVPAGGLAKPYNPGQPHHYVVQAAVRALDNWLRTGKAPASTPIVATRPDGEKWAFVTDANGIAKGGVRTPWTDVPTMRLAGIGNEGGFIGMMVGVGEPFDAAKLASLYPGGKAEFLKRFTESLDAAIARGHILGEDRQEILEVAAISYQGSN
ncbi:MAG: alpha/beta hydrolase domain-containing protein [Caulobacter sp.]|nr:alpha/beta hydrolase domain-containing protein [Caulobacter sp.]